MLFLKQTKLHLVKFTQQLCMTIPLQWHGTNVLTLGAYHCDCYSVDSSAQARLIF